MENISLFTAWGHVASTASYWVWLLIATAISTIIFAMVIKSVKKSSEFTIDKIFFLLIGVAIFLFALLMRPCEVAANTTKDQAARGIFIGY